MSSKFTRKFVGAAISFSAAILVASSGAERVAAQQPAAQQLAAQQAPTGWHSYYGCWQPVSAQSSSSVAGAPGRAVCIIPVEGAAAIQFITVINDSVIDRLRVNTGGERVSASREGCTGWESASRGLASRVYMKSEYTCEGGVQRRSSGLIAMLSPDEWMDVQTIEVGGHASVTMQRYREVPPPVVVAVEVNERLDDRGMAISSSRVAAAAALSLDDIVDASRNATPSTVEVWLLEKRQGFVLQRKHVEYLADRKVPTGIIDMIVALSYSEFFRAEISQRRLALYPSMERPDNPSRVASPDYVRPAGSNMPVTNDNADRHRSYNYDRGDYFYDQNYYSPFGFFFYDAPTYRNRYYRPVQPVVVIIKPGGSGRSGGGGDPPVDPPVVEPPPGRLIQGRGYTNGTQAAGTTNQSSSDVTGTNAAGGSTNTTTGTVTGRGGRGASGTTSGGSNAGTTTGTTSSGAATGRSTGTTTNTGAATPPATPPARTAQPRQNSTTNRSGGASSTSGGSTTNSGSSSSSGGSSTTTGGTTNSGSSGSSSGGSTTTGGTTTTGRGRGGGF